MDALLQTLLSDPLYFLGVVVAFAAAFYFLIFLRGFLSGSPHLFTISSRTDTLKIHRKRAIWGVMGIAFILTLWEVVRAITHWFTS